MKNCTKCKKSKRGDDFFNKRNTKSSWCKKCLYDYQARRWNRNKTLLVKEKGEKCERCGYVGHPSTFDFHHNDPTQKEFTIGHIRCYSLKRLRKEIEKCKLLCACCHRLVHISDNNWDFTLDPPKPKPKSKSICWCGNKCKMGEKFCSSKCSSKSQEIIIWPDNLPELVVNSSKLKVAKSLGVSDKAVAKRLRNHHSIIQ